MFAPVGALNANWSSVKHSPPAFSMRALAVAVNRSAATVTFGTVRRRVSSVMVPMTTMVLSGRARAPRRESETGGRLMREVNRRRKTTALKGDDVRPDQVRLVVSVDREHWDAWGSGERTSKETVELDEEFEVDVVALGGFAMGAAHMVSVEIDT